MSNSADRFTSMLLQNFDVQKYDNLYRIKLPNKTEYISDSPMKQIAHYQTYQRFNIPPNGALPSGAMSGGQIIFQMPNGIIPNKIHTTHWETNVGCGSVSGTGTVTIGNAYFLLNHTDICTDGSTNQFETFPSEYNYLQNNNYYYEQMQCIGQSNLLGINPITFADVNTTLTAGQSLFYRYEWKSLMNSIFMQTVTANINIIYWPNTNPYYAQTGDGLVQWAGNPINLCVTTESGPFDFCNTERLLANPYRINYTNPLLQTYYQSITAAQQNQILLTGAPGLASGFVVMIRSAKTTIGGGYTNFTSLDAGGLLTSTIDIQNDRSVSIFGGSSGILAINFRSSVAANHFNGTMPAYKAIYFIALGPDGYGIYNHGSASGVLALTGNEKLILTPSVGFTSGMYYVDVLFLQCAIAEVAKGIVSRIL